MSRQIRTMEQLEEALDVDLAWRKKELADLKLLCNAQQEMNCLLRSTFVMSCAHFEGFIKYATNAYLAYLSSLELTCEQIRVEYASMIVRNKKHALFNSKSGKKVKVSVVTDMLKYYEEVELTKFRISLDDSDMPIVDEDQPAITTEGNPSPEVLKEISKLIGLDYNTLFKTREQFIDRELLLPRHKIAHGQHYPVSEIELAEAIEYVFTMMESIKSSIISLVESNAHLRY